MVFRIYYPAGTPRYTQANSSNLVDAYKWSELEPSTQLECLVYFQPLRTELSHVSPYWPIRCFVLA